jgi:SAM-dependent methyltransferase
MHLPPQLCCLKHSQPLTAEPVDSPIALICPVGCGVPVVRNIPRFVDSSSYASGFGLQWNTFRKTQLDSYSGTTISRDRLTRCFGGSLDLIRDKSVLEVGCGAGRFTELLLEAGAHVFACDLSQAVDANYENCHHWPNYFVCQADARQLPVLPNSFDFVLCIGVIQHTPSPEETIAALARQLKPGGLLVVDHYSHAYIQNVLQRNLRRLLIRMPARSAKLVTLGLARGLLPLHRTSWKWKRRRGLWRLRPALLKHSPFIDYLDLFPELGDQLVAEWSVLDTHDALTDYYKHLRTREEIEACLRSCGLIELEVSYSGNGIEARAKMPVARVERAANTEARAALTEE